MNDMTVKELIDIVMKGDKVWTYAARDGAGNIIGEVKEYREAKTELLRRFEELEKEVDRHKRTAICMYCGTIQQTKDGQEKLAMIIEHMAVCEKHPVPKLLGDIENMKNCGNCHNFYRADMAEPCRKTFPFNSCRNWQSDGLTREEREGK